MKGSNIFSRISGSKNIFKDQYSVLTKNQQGVPKGHVAVYVGNDRRTRCTMPIAHLNHPFFRQLLNSIEEEFGFNHSMGGLTLPCNEDVFHNLMCQLNSSKERCTILQ